MTVTRTPERAHDALFYGSDGELVSALRPFLREGLTRDHATVAALTRANIELLRDALGDDAAGVTFIDRDEWYQQPSATVAGWQRLLTEAREQGRSQVRIVGEVGFGPANRHRTWTRYEAALNRLFADAPAWIVCPYDERVLPEALLAEARRTHPTVWDRERRRSAEYLAPEEYLSRVAEPLPAVAAEPAVDVPLNGDIAAARRLVRDTAAAGGYPTGERLDHLTVAASEVITNALRHGKGRRTLRVWVGESAVVCEVSDEGPGPSDPMIGYRPPGDSADGGRGLWIAYRLCDSVAVNRDNGTTRVRFAVRH